MAVLKVCAVRDRAVDAFGNPFFVVAIGQATRSFADEVNNQQSVFFAHPEDYDLYLVGEFDNQSGVLVACTPPRQLMIGKDAKRPLNDA